MSPILEPLEPLRQEVSILLHLDNVTAGNHVRMTSAFLTGRGVDHGRCPVSLDQLVAAEIGGSTLLDNSIVLYGSGMKDGNGPRRENLPILLAGSGGGKLRPGQHFVLREQTPLASLHLTLVHCFGLPLEHFNNSSRSEVSEILA